MRNDLREWLVKHTNCDIQTNGWPCGTCAIELFRKLGVDELRLNALWQSILDIRDKEKKERAD